MKFREHVKRRSTDVHKDTREEKIEMFDFSNATFF